MKGKNKFFLDTNIFVYTFDSTSPQKQHVAKKLIENSLTEHNGVISFQVIQEFLNVATKKFSKPMAWQEASLYLEHVLAPLCDLYPTISFYESVFKIKNQTQFSFYDSMIVTAAIQLQCSVLYSEDLQDGQVIEGLKIKNPFLIKK